MGQSICKCYNKDAIDSATCENIESTRSIGFELDAALDESRLPVKLIILNDAGNATHENKQEVDRHSASTTDLTSQSKNHGHGADDDIMNPSSKEGADLEETKICHVIIVNDDYKEMNNEIISNAGSEKVDGTATIGAREQDGLIDQSKETDLTLMISSSTYKEEQIDNAGLNERNTGDGDSHSNDDVKLQYGEGDSTTQNFGHRNKLRLVQTKKFSVLDPLDQ